LVRVMKIRFSILFGVIFTIVFTILLVLSSNYFNTSWLIAIITIPSSQIAFLAINSISNIFGINDTNIILTFVILFIFGILQYGLVGYLLDLAIKKIKGVGDI